MPKAKAEKRKKREKEEGEEDEGIVTIPISTSNEKEEEKKEKKQYEENIVEEGEPNYHKIKKKKNRVSEDVISWKEEGEEEEEEEALNYLPGQKHDRPGKRDPLRIFYETLYQKAPDCELAETWMMEWGLLPPKVAEKVYETKFGHNQQISPGLIKAASTSEVPKSKRLSNSVLKTKKRKSSETNSADDFRLPKKKKIKQQVSST